MHAWGLLAGCTVQQHDLVQKLRAKHKGEKMAVTFCWSWHIDFSCFKPACLENRERGSGMNSQTSQLNESWERRGVCGEKEVYVHGVCLCGLHTDGLARKAEAKQKRFQQRIPQRDRKDRKGKTFTVSFTSFISAHSELVRNLMYLIQGSYI